MHFDPLMNRQRRIRNTFFPHTKRVTCITRDRLTLLDRRFHLLPFYESTVLDNSKTAGRRTLKQKNNILGLSLWTQTLLRRDNVTSNATCGANRLKFTKQRETYGANKGSRDMPFVAEAHGAEINWRLIGQFQQLARCDIREPNREKILNQSLVVFGFEINTVC